MVPGSLKETSFSYRRNRVNQSGNSPGLSSFVAGTGPTNQSDNVKRTKLCGRKGSLSGLLKAAQHLEVQ